MKSDLPTCKFGVKVVAYLQLHRSIIIVRQFPPYLKRLSMVQPRLHGGLLYTTRAIWFQSWGDFKHFERSNVIIEKVIVYLFCGDLKRREEKKSLLKCRNCPPDGITLYLKIDFQFDDFLNRGCHLKQMSTRWSHFSPKTQFQWDDSLNRGCH